MKKLFDPALSLKLKLPLSIVIIVAITFTISTAFTLYSFSNVAKSVKASNLQAASQNVGEGIGTRIRQAGRDMVMVASMPNVMQAVQISPDHIDTLSDADLRANLRILFERVLLAYGYYNSFYIINEQGEYIVGTRSTERNFSKGWAKQLFDDAMKKNGFSIGLTTNDPSSGLPVIPIFLEMVYNGYGGFLVSSLSVNKIVNSSLQEFFNDGIDHLVVSFDESLPLEIARNENFKLPLGDWVEQLKGKTSGVISGSFDGKDYILGYYKVAQTDIYVVSMARTSYLQNPTEILLNTVLIANIIALLMIMICVYYFTKPVTRDISHLSNFAKAITDGRDDIDINLNRNDELGVLATSLGKMVDTLKKMVLTSESATKAKSDFLACMSHEIRTPMNGIIGMTYLAMQANPDEKQMDYLRRIDTAAKTLLAVINDILDFSKIEAEKMDINSITFRISGVLASMRDMLEPKCNEKGIVLKFTVDDNVPDIILSDPLRFSQICINLCSNAIKFTAEGEVHLHISLSKRQNENLILQVEVKDSGIGMTAEAQEKVFDSFSQADGSTTRKFGGTGLGLAICKNLTHLLGGEIWVESKINEGSTFFFTICASEGLESELEDDDKTPNVEYSLPNLQVLLAEDNEINQVIALEILGNMGVNVSLANNGAEALSMWNDGDFDIIILDIQMPIMDGLTAAGEIRKSSKESSKTVPIIAMTAHAMTGDREKSIQAGMNDHITKPINIEELYNVLVFWGTAARSENIVV